MCEYIYIYINTYIYNIYMCIHTYRYMYMYRMMPISEQDYHLEATVSAPQTRIVLKAIGQPVQAQGEI